MNYYKLKMILKSKGVVKSNNVDKVCFHSKGESSIHFLIKSILAHMIFSTGNQGVVTEAEFEKGRVIDVLQVFPSGNCVGYEIEGTKNRKPDVEGIDIIEINIKEIPHEMKGNLKKLRDWLKVMIV